MMIQYDACDVQFSHVLTEWAIFLTVLLVDFCHGQFLRRKWATFFTMPLD